MLEFKISASQTCLSNAHTLYVILLKESILSSELSMIKELKNDSCSKCIGDWYSQKIWLIYSDTGKAG